MDVTVALQILAILDSRMPQGGLSSKVRDRGHIPDRSGFLNLSPPFWMLSVTASLPWLGYRKRQLHGSRCIVTRCTDLPELQWAVSAGGTHPRPGEAGSIAGRELAVWNDQRTGGQGGTHCGHGLSPRRPGLQRSNVLIIIIINRFVYCL